MMVTYLKLIVSMMHQKISDKIPRTDASVIARCAVRKHCRRAYNGLVPMSPNTTPSAARVITGKAAFCAVLCIFRLRFEHYFFAMISPSKNFCSKSIVSTWQSSFFSLLSRSNGEVSEWLKEHAWKVCIRLRVSRVRIPLSPPDTKDLQSKAVTKGLNCNGLSLFYRILFSKNTQRF